MAARTKDLIMTPNPTKNTPRIGRISAIVVLVLALTSVAALSAPRIFVPPGSINGVKHAIGKNGRLKGNAVGTRQLKRGVVTCAKLSFDLNDVLCLNGRAKGFITAKNGQNGQNGTPGSNGLNGATGAKGTNGENGGRGDGVTLVTIGTPGIVLTNPSVNLTPLLGVVLGPYTDNTMGGSVGVDIGPGHTLRDIAQLSYSASFTATTNNGDAPYLRIFIDNDQDGIDDHDVIFAPSTQPGACYGPFPILGLASQCATSNRLIHYEVTQGTVRYDDDPGSLPDVPWAAVVNAHGNDKVSSIYVTSGFSLPDTTGAVLNSFSYEVAGQPPSTLAFAHS